ncbi:MAG: tetratricopeptide repeat protein, partial [Clostridia bacterium]|nr:tetratricopeptide repeat protein [Clostridia bacterium]
MKNILFMLVLTVVCFYITPIAGLIASVIFLIYAAYRYLPNFYAISGNKKYSQGDIQGALARYKKAIETGRADDKLKTAYSLLLLRNGYPEGAERGLDEVIRNKQGKAEDKRTARQYRCMAYCKQGRMDEAMEDAKELFSESKNTVTYGIMGYFMQLVNAPLDETLALCEEAYDYNSDDRDIVDNLVLALIRNGSLDRAKELAADLVEKNPNFVEAYYHSALCEARLGNKAAARELLS